MNDLNAKMHEHFAGLVVRKDLVKTVKGNAIVPSFVLEYLLGQYCATADPKSVQSGIETVKEILRKHFVHRNEAGLVRSSIKERGHYKVIDKISVALNDKNDCYEASFSNLGIKKVVLDSVTIKKHPKLLVGGVWCIADIGYEHMEDTHISPWLINSIKPIQLSHFEFDSYVEARRQFSLDEWIDLLIHSIGFNPELFGKRSKLQQLVRLIPFCERNYNLIELGPKGTGKSHVYSEFSPHGILISGGEVTVAKLFVNNSSGKIGLVGYWDTVAFDEFAGRKKKANKALVDILKNYMANKTFSRGIETLGAEASMVFVGNTQHTLPYMLKNSELFDELPEQFHDSAFLDRLHFYLPGWEMDNIRAEMFSDGYGFVVDYLAEILRSLRNHDYSDKYQKYFQLHHDISTRDRDGIHKTFSGLMKILYPHGEASKEEIETLLRFAIEGRKRVKDQLMKIDSTYQAVRFGYLDNESGVEKSVNTLEEEEYPQYFAHNTAPTVVNCVQHEAAIESPFELAAQQKTPKEGQVVIQENQRGITFDLLFAPYIKGATNIVITDSYIRIFYQTRNLMEFLETIARQKGDEEEVEVHLITIKDGCKGKQQVDYFKQISASCATIGIHFSWQFDDSNTIHARHIELNNGWKILLDRGLDIFQHYDMGDAFSFANRVQRYRSCKACEITYLANQNLS